ncbi:MAG: hypothetical protein WCJ25_04525 [Candidatus Moraniibacteriota bacterium]
MSKPKNTLSAFELYQAFVDYSEKNYAIDKEGSLYDSNPIADVRTANLMICLSGESYLQIGFHVSSNLKKAYFLIRTPYLTTENFLVKKSFHIGTCGDIEYEDETAYGIVKNFLYEVLRKHQLSCVLSLRAEEPTCDNVFKNWTYRIDLINPESCTPKEFTDSLHTVNFAAEALMTVWEEAMENLSKYKETRERNVNEFIEAIRKKIPSRAVIVSNP